MSRWSFGEFVLDLEARELLRAGNPVSLSPKALALLGILVGQRPRALSKNELQDQLWPDTFVVEKNLTNLVGEIREALGDDPARPRFIRTVPRFGYAFSEATTAAAAARRHNLPERLTSFVGRDLEVAELLRRLPSTRLLTLTGAGGCGKTRVALEVASRVLDRFPDGVWMVDLAPLPEASLVPQAVASALDIRPTPNRTFVEAISDHCCRRDVLLVFDNCEHLIAACAELADALLRGAPRPSILATSRERLGVGGETVWHVPSLSKDHAVSLFVERATAADPAFAVTPTNAAAIAQVCDRLDGIPLAIELAAARLKVLSIDQINARLDDRFRLLTGGSRTASARQQTLEATVAWSYDLLSEPERVLFQRLAVFAGRCTLEAAEDVCSGEGIERTETLDLLSRLVDKSLVNFETSVAGLPQYRFLETVRQYARDRLLRSGEAERTRDRHLAFFAGLARRAEPELTRADQLAWLDRLQDEHDNLRLALEWSLASPKRAAQALMLGTALSFFWWKCSYFGEGQRWLEAALAANGSAPAAERAQALMGLGNVIFFQGDFARASEVLGQSAALARAAGNRFASTIALGMRSLAALELGDLGEAARLAAESREEGRASDVRWAQGPALSCLAYIALHEGDADRAGRLHEEALELLRAQGEKWGMSISVGDLALLRVVQRRFGEARALCVEGIALFEQFRDRRGIGYCLGILGGVDAAEGRALRAARLQGAMEGVLESVGAPVQPSFDRWVGEPYFAAVKESLGGARFETARAEGRAMSLAEAIQFGLEDRA